MKIKIEAVQFTPDREPVVIQWSGEGPLSHSSMFHTTQTALGGGVWGDDECKAAIRQHLLDIGINADLIVNDGLPVRKPKLDSRPPTKEKAETVKDGEVAAPTEG